MVIAVVEWDTIIASFFAAAGVVLAAYLQHRKTREKSDRQQAEVKEIAVQAAVKAEEVHQDTKQVREELKRNHGSSAMDGVHDAIRQMGNEISARIDRFEDKVDVRFERIQDQQSRLGYRIDEHEKQTDNLFVSLGLNPATPEMRKRVMEFLRAMKKKENE